MPSGTTRTRIVAGPEFRLVANALREIDRTLPGKLRKDIRNQVRPLVRRAKAKVRVLPVYGHAGPYGRDHTGMRARVARGVSIRVGTGRNSYIRILTRMADPKQAVIPRGLDDTRGWTHPVFGHGEAREHAAGGWFVETFADGKDEIERGILHVLEEACIFVARQGGH